MAGFVFDGYSVSGSVEAIEALQMAFSRKAALEHMCAQIKGYPSIMEMEVHVRDLNPPAASVDQL